jgi:hypothetical protein
MSVDAVKNCGEVVWRRHRGTWGRAGERKSRSFVPLRMTATSEVGVLKLLRSCEPGLEPPFWERFCAASRPLPAAGGAKLSSKGQEGARAEAPFWGTLLRGLKALAYGRQALPRTESPGLSPKARRC